MKEYTVGVCVHKDVEDLFFLLKKNSPVNQKGYLNFPGGKMEPGETPEECVSREIREEIGVDVPAAHWKYIGKMERPGDFIVHILYTDSDDLVMSKQQEDHELWCITKTDFMKGIFKNVDTLEETNLIMPNVDLIFRFIYSEDFKNFGCNLNIMYPEKSLDEEDYANVSR